MRCRVTANREYAGPSIVLGIVCSCNDPESPERYVLKNLLFVLSVFALAAIATGTASASPIIVTPTGLVPGGHFRVAFVTSSTTNATSSNLSTYDSFVTTDANGATYNGAVIRWQAIMSNSTTNARDHIGLTSSSTIPIYLVFGEKVSDGNLWSGSLLHSIDQTITGSEILSTVWTDTESDGTYSSYIENEYHTVGLSSQRFTWSVGAQSSIYGTHHHLYGISEILSSPSAVPEPSAVMLADLGGLAAWAYSYMRKRNSCRR